MCPQEMTMSSTPWRRSQSSMKAMNGRSTSGTTGLGTVVVSGRSRVPSPPARIRACIRPSPRRPCGARPGRAGRRPRRSARRPSRPSGSRKLRPSISSVPRMPSATAREVELAELRPLGDEHDGVGAVDAASARTATKSTPWSSLRASLLGDRVVGAHLRAGGLQPRGEHERGRLAHVVGVRLEREPEQRDLLADQRAEVLLQLRHHAPLLQLVDLDDRVEQLEVVARVAGELLERA